MSGDVSRRAFVKTAGVSTAGLALANVMLASADAWHGKDRDRTRDSCAGIRNRSMPASRSPRATWRRRRPRSG